MFPTLISAQRSEGVLNIGSADPDKQPLGVRETVTFTMRDHPYHDRYTDPYQRSRSYNPMAQGTFAGKFLARNDNYEGWECIYYIGKVGDLLGDMRAINYEIESIRAPGSDGVWSVEVSDVLRRADNNRATIPRRSRGTLSADLNISATSFTLTTPTPEELAAYPAEGFIIVDDEKMEYTRSGDAFTVTRAYAGSVAAEHDEGALVQLAYEVDDRVDDILYDMLVNQVGVPDEWIVFADWQDEADSWLPTYSYETVIWKPVGANEIIGDLLRDSSAYIIPDLINKRLVFQAIRPAELVKTVDEDDNILLGSFRKVAKPEQRLTQLWLNYAMRDTLGSMTDRSNFSKLKVRFSTDVIDAGTQKIKEIFSRFIGAGNPAEAELTARRIVERFEGIQEEYHFSLEGDDAEELTLGKVVLIQHRANQDEFGASRPVVAQVIAMKEAERGGRVEYTAQPFAFGFATTVWANDEIPNWDDASAEDQAQYLYWSDEDGLIDGEEGPGWA
jgi:hypothetical protein